MKTLRILLLSLGLFFLPPGAQARVAVLVHGYLSDAAPGNTAA